MSPAYALGHVDRELERLTAQARVIDPITLRVFRDAGITPGMRVLDVGSGAGDVAFLVAGLVGEKGEVVGTDPSEAAISVARRRALDRSYRNVSFCAGDPAEMAFDRSFDAIVGRYVLMFLPIPAVSLRKLVSHLRPGGVVAFHELDLEGVGSTPPLQIYDLCCRWINRTLAELGTEIRMGLKLHSTFMAAGLPAPAMRLEAVIQAGAEALDLLLLTTELVRTLLPEMIRLNIATDTDVGIETLAERMRAEAAAGRHVVVRHSEISAWCRLAK